MTTSSHERLPALVAAILLLDAAAVAFLSLPVLAWMLGPYSAHYGPFPAWVVPFHVIVLCLTALFVVQAFRARRSGMLGLFATLLLMGAIVVWDNVQALSFHFEQRANGSIPPGTSLTSVWMLSGGARWLLLIAANAWLLFGARHRGFFGRAVRNRPED